MSGPKEEFPLRAGILNFRGGLPGLSGIGRGEEFNGGRHFIRRGRDVKRNGEIALGNQKRKRLRNNQVGNRPGRDRNSFFLRRIRDILNLFIAFFRFFAYTGIISHRPFYGRDHKSRCQQEERNQFRFHCRTIGRGNFRGCMYFRRTPNQARFNRVRRRFRLLTTRRDLIDRIGLFSPGGTVRFKNFL